MVLKPGSSGQERGTRKKASVASVVTRRVLRGAAHMQDGALGRETGREGDCLRGGGVILSFII